MLSPAVDVDGGQVDDGRVARVEEEKVFHVSDDELVGHVARLLEEAAEDAVGVARPDVRHLEELVAQEEGVGGGGLVEDVEDAEDLRVAHAEAGHGRSLNGGRVDGGVVLGEAVGEGREVEVLGQLLAEDGGHVLAEVDLGRLGDGDSSRGGGKDDEKIKNGRIILKKSSSSSSSITSPPGRAPHRPSVG